MKQALRFWEQAAEITFVEKGPDEPAEMMIGFGYGEHGCGYPFDGENGLLAHAWPAGDFDVNGDAHFDEAEFWTLGKGKVGQTYEGNSGGAGCHFPFVYNGKEYSRCITNNEHPGFENHEWCGTTSNYDVDRKYGLCASETLFTYGGNAGGAPCVFPFVFLNTTYPSCTKDGRTDNYRWCATTSNYDVDGQWAFCPDRESATHGGTGNGDDSPCHFPFIFNGDSYESCTIVGRDDGRTWCSKTANYDIDKKWGFCKNDGYSLLLVAAHEFGHTIGLDHSRSKSALMYPTYSAVENFELPQDDINGARRLYGPRRSALPPLELERCGGGGTEGFVRTTTTAPNTRGKTRPNIKTTTQATTTRSNTASSDNVCDLTSVDAVLLFNPEIYVFKGYYFWRINSRNKAIRRGPYLISDQWPGGPRTVDAAYKRPQDEAVILFKGQRYWIFDSYHLKAGYPKYLSELGLPQSLLKVDLAVNWYRSKHRKRTYFFSGDQYFRYNELKERMDRRYPKNIVNWNMDYTDFDAAIEDPYTKRHTVFFRGNRVYLLHNYKFNIRGVYNLDAYLGCREETVRLARPAPIRDVNQP